MTLVGCDPDMMDQLSLSMRRCGDGVDSVLHDLDDTMTTLDWQGDDRDRFKAEWTRLDSQSAEVRGAIQRLSDLLTANAMDQRSVSKAETAVGTPPTEPSAPSKLGDGGDKKPEAIPDWLQDLLHDLGLAQSAIDSLFDLAKGAPGLWRGLEALKPVAENEAVGMLMNGLGKAIDIADVVVDFATDFGANEDLDLDERLVHAAASAAIGFGMSQGIEVAMAALGGAIGTAMFPGLGTTVGGAVGKAIGWGLSTITEEILDHTGAGDAVQDWGADRIVDIYTAVRDATPEIVENITDGVETVIDFGEGVIDFGGDVVDGLSDGAGSLYRNTLGRWF